MTTQDPYAHVDARLRHLVLAEDGVRRQAIMSDAWVSYPAGEEAVSTLLWLVDQPARLKMPSFLFCANPHMGKSRIIARFKELYLQSLAENPERDTALMVNAPPTCDERRLYEAIIFALEMRPPIDVTLSRLQRIVLDQLTVRRVRLLIIDEMQQVVDQKPAIVRICLNTLKYLSNELRISIAGFGSGEAKGMIKADPHLAVRFSVVDLEALTRREPWVRKVIVERIALMPLRRPTVIDRELLDALRSAAKGRVGDYFDVLEEAGLLAIDTGQEQLTPDLISQGVERRRKGKR